MERDLGETTSIDVVNGLVSLDGQVVIDVGCGDMTFSRLLAQAGARVLAIDPDPVQAELNRAAASTAGVEFVESGAERLPVADGSVDGVFFSFSLHHVPAAQHDEVLAEVVRALGPSGYLCVIEPMRGPLAEVMEHFHDERREQAAAQDALRTLAVPRFETHRVFRYHSFVEHESFDAFARTYGQRSYNAGYTEADVRRPEVEETFERLGRPDYRFVSPKQMMFLERPRTPPAPRD